jgi:hypothetical protein
MVLCTVSLLGFRVSESPCYRESQHPNFQKQIVWLNTGERMLICRLLKVYSRGCGVVLECDRWPLANGEKKPVHQLATDASRFDLGPRGKEVRGAIETTFLKLYYVI